MNLILELSDTDEDVVAIRLKLDLIAHQPLTAAQKLAIGIIESLTKETT